MMFLNIYFDHFKGLVLSSYNHTYFLSFAVSSVRVSLYLHHSPYNLCFYKLCTVILFYLKTNKIGSTLAKQTLKLLHL